MRPVASYKDVEFRNKSVGTRDARVKLKQFREELLKKAKKDFAQWFEKVRIAVLRCSTHVSHSKKDNIYCPTEEHRRSFCWHTK